MHSFDHAIGFGADIPVVEVVGNQTVEDEFPGGGFSAETRDAGLKGDQICVGGGDCCSHGVTGGVPTGIAHELGTLPSGGEGIEQFGVGGSGPAEISVCDGDSFACGDGRGQLANESIELVGVAFGSVEVEDIVGFGGVTGDGCAACFKLILEGFADGFSFVGSDLIKTSGVRRSDCDGGFPFGLIGEGAADQAVGNLVDSHAELSSRFELEPIDFLVEGGDFSGVGPYGGGVVLPESEVIKRSVKGHLEKLNLDVDVAGSNGIVAGQFGGWDFRGESGGFALCFGVVVEFCLLAGDGPIIEILAPGSVFGDGGRGNSSEGAEDIEGGFEIGFADSPEFAESGFGQGF